MPVNRRSTMTQYERQDDGLDSALQPTTSQLIDTRLLIEDQGHYRRNSLKAPPWLPSGTEFLAFLAALLDRLCHDHAPRGLILIALGSALMFMTTLAVALGVAASAALISADGSSRLLSGLHMVALVLAAPAAPSGVAFFAATAILSRNGAPLRSWLAASA
jgi:hypothetical protein